jgi:hypothetical protein
MYAAFRIVFPRQQSHCRNVEDSDAAADREVVGGTLDFS